MINYNLISKAIKAYKKLGYTYIDVPWTVEEDIVNITLPSFCKAFSYDKNNFLVGSAEQSFLHLILKENLKSGKYVAASPCFRDDIIDEYHKKHFFKVELIHFCDEGTLDNFHLNDVLFNAKNVLSSLTKKKIKIVHYDKSVDLEIDGVEVGSYGIRSFRNFNWIYGTGIAEPRFSQLR